jgi:hypothetical protein
MVRLGYGPVPCLRKPATNAVQGSHRVLGQQSQSKLERVVVLEGKVWFDAPIAMNEGRTSFARAHMRWTIDTHGRTVAVRHAFWRMGIRSVEFWLLAGSRKDQLFSDFILRIEDRSVGFWLLARSENKQQFSKNEGRWLFAKSESNQWCSGVFER